MPSGSEPLPGAFSRAVTAELRAVMGRHGISAREVAAAAGRSPGYVTKRLRDEASFTTNDLADICAGINLDLLSLLVAAVRSYRGR